MECAIRGDDVIGDGSCETLALVATVVDIDAAAVELPAWTPSGTVLRRSCRRTFASKELFDLIAVVFRSVAARQSRSKG